MIRVLIVDDSATVRRVLTTELSRFPDIEVVGGAQDPYVARDMIVELKPDVVTLDVEMPRMDGLSFLKKLMRHHPMPVVMVSSVVPANSRNAMDALEAGAVEVVPKPAGPQSIPDVGRILVQAVRAAAAADLGRLLAPRRAVSTSPRPVAAETDGVDLFAIGASTGGTKALAQVFSCLPEDIPPVVVVQHMPPGFTQSFAERLDQLAAIRVKEGESGDSLERGTGYIAPGGTHMLVERRGSRLRIKLKDGPPVNFHRPSVDVLFQSVARSAGAKVRAAILTGMGSDGAKGLLTLRKAGAHTISQSADTCAVYGMPRAADELGASVESRPLDQVASALLATRVPARG